MTEYKITSLKDLLNIPVDRVDDCLDELKDGLKLMHAQMVAFEIPVADAVFDSPFKQTPSASKELAEQAVARYRKLHHRMFHSEVIANAYDEWFQVQQWHGTRKDHIRKMFYVQDWFNQPMFQIFDMSRAVDIFSREDIVICYKKGSVPIVTKDIEEAKHFYEVA